MAKNKVARILKIYSIINAVVVFLASVIIASQESEILIFIIGATLAICVNFVIYSFGELIDLLAQISYNTKTTTTKTTEVSYDDLPDL